MTAIVDSVSGPLYNSGSGKKQSEICTATVGSLTHVAMLVQDVRGANVGMLTAES